MTIKNDNNGKPILPPSLLYQPMSFNGRRKLKPRVKPQSMMTDEERRLWADYLTRLRTYVGKRGGMSLRGKHARGGRNRVAVWVLPEDYDVIMRYADERDKAMWEIFHDFAAEIRAANPQLFAEQNGQG